MVKEFFKTILYEPLYNLLIFFAWLVPGHSIGWAIILLTIVVKILLWVPSVKGIRAPLQMRVHQPELKKIQERYKDDRAMQSQALMAYYKEHGVNPLAGCLPLLIQLPVILILYNVFVAGLKDIRPDIIYSFTPHLDTINTHFLGLDLSKPDRIFLPLIIAALQFFQARHMQKINPPVSNDPKDPMVIISKQSVFLFPLMTYFFALSFPAGVSLYWGTSTLFQLLQQLYIQKTFVTPKPKVAVTVRSKKK